MVDLDLPLEGDDAREQIHRIPARRLMGSKRRDPWNFEGGGAALISEAGLQIFKFKIKVFEIRQLQLKKS